ncbi:rhamnogalacturonan acetylesterase [Saccharicrinis fermentans]|uniref:Rhamnogalacturonan acetylesterase RhgT n=1 Tax=Saccharicrinis fermentans DSM 9555 = JCM 21142 TaxID=869213 RepID=W7XVI1_9BACT|nr:rhamnogalacturonan acetylesterase [Saccharicrinis fermentans]GAF02110.1 rhamnogalacturonan acetylesterase RhgT [Saccharicrinis fermentans DSM 9555 = JCM 21142]
MKIQNLLIIAIGILLISCREQKNESINIFICGDSTAQSYDTSKTVMRGWAQMLPDFFDEHVTIINKAKAGRSTKSYLAEKRWKEVMDSIQADDYVIIQFGHNDASSKPERHASYADYKQNLIKMIKEAKAKQARPILATSIVMRTFKDNALIDDRLKAYPAITRQLADSLNIPLIDTWLQSRDLVVMLGDEPSKALYMWIEAGIDSIRPNGSQDDTHLQSKGAVTIAEMVATDIKKQNLKDIATHVIIP